VRRALDPEGASDAGVIPAAGVAGHVAAAPRDLHTFHRLRAVHRELRECRQVRSRSRRPYNPRTMMHVLTYDTFPPHSSLRREVMNGSIKITAAAEEPGPRARRVELQRAALGGALLSAALLAAFVLAVASTYLAHRRHMGFWLFTVLVISFAVFCAALFLLLWRAAYAARIEKLERAMRQTTILVASPGRLLVETAGPFGQQSHDLCTRVGGPYRVTDFQLGSIERHTCLLIVLATGQRIRVLPGRDDAELDWVARTLRGTIGI
jgi:hypothetical protein